jgi:hypothetical protein
MLQVGLRHGIFVKDFVQFKFRADIVTVAMCDSAGCKLDRSEVILHSIEVLNVGLVIGIRRIVVTYRTAAEGVRLCANLTEVSAEPRQVLALAYPSHSGVDYVAGNVKRVEARACVPTPYYTGDFSIEYETRVELVAREFVDLMSPIIVQSEMHVRC